MSKRSKINEKGNEKKEEKKPIVSNNDNFTLDNFTTLYIVLLICLGSNKLVQSSDHQGENLYKMLKNC